MFGHLDTKFIATEIDVSTYDNNLTLYLYSA
jgi:hypothetical protein